MSPRFSTEFKEQVRARTDLVELVGETVALSPQGGGSDFVGLCPFHDDHKPSFHVYPDRQSYRCWVCDEGGDCFSYLMKIEAVDFPQALEMLARRANIEPPQQYSRNSQNNQQDKNQLYPVLAWAEDQFHQCLRTSAAGEPARNYLTERGFTPETIEQFRIGFHPDEWEWLLGRARGKFSPEELFAARLVRERRDGAGFRDDFVGRVMFPIRDERARPVAFGGRILPGNDNPDAPKYLNSPESIVFTKSRLLFGFDASREGIRRSQTAVVVEGYTDCIMATQHGLRNVVGTLGTSLTEEHVRALKRFAQKVVLVFDGDDPGQKAAERVITKFIAQDVDLRILTLSDGQDPADFLEQNGLQAFEEQIGTAPEAWEYKLQASIKHFGLESIDARERVLGELVELLSQAPRLSGTDRENILLGRLAHRVGLAELNIRNRLNETRKQNASRKARMARVDASESFEQPVASAVTKNKYDLLECEILGIIFTNPALIETIRGEIAVNDFRDRNRKELLQLCFDLAEEGAKPTYDKVTTVLEDAELKRLAASLDRLANEQQIDEKLREDEGTREESATPAFLERILQGLIWRRQEESYELSKGQTAIPAGSPGELDLEAREQLRRMQEFHGKRAQQKTST